MDMIDHLYYKEQSGTSFSQEVDVRFGISLLNAYIQWGNSFPMGSSTPFNGRKGEFQIWNDLGVFVNHVSYAGRNVGVDDEGFSWLIHNPRLCCENIDLTRLCNKGYVKIEVIDDRNVYFLTDKIFSHTPNIVK